MRATEFLQEQIIDEVSMKPSILRQEAAKTKALAGIEFEMIVPDVSTDDGDQEPDYDSDERVTDFDSIGEFFNEGGMNSSSDIRKMIEGLKEGYYEWAGDHRWDQWADEGFDFFREYIEDDFDEDSAREEAEEEIKNEYGDDFDNLTPEDLDKLVDALVAEKKDSWIEEEWEDQGRLYDRARDSWEEDADWPDEQDYLRREGYTHMSDLPYGDYGVYWPYYTGGGNTSIEKIASDFEQAIGRSVNYATDYHQGKREENTYVVEPDGSLKPDNSDDGGLEFVSPPMPIDEMLSDFNKVIEWAKSKGCYTNDSTGLHMNVSVPNFSRENCDYVKLALLLGDRYVLEQFGRVANTYAKSAMSKVIANIKRNPDQAQGLLQQMKTNLYPSASKMIHSGITEKYTSINAHEGYIEFRSPGGDWLNADWSKLENTLLRFVVALDAACDPQKYRQEYLKKLYQVLQPDSETDPIALFAKFSSGQMSKQELASLVKQAQLQRQLSKQPVTGQKYWWRVTNPANAFASIEVVAANKEEAIKTAVEPGNYPEWARVQNTLQAKPLRPYRAPATRNWGIWVNAAQRFARIQGQTDDNNIYRFPTREEAERWIEQRRAETPGMRTDIEVREIEPSQQSTPTGNQQYEVYLQDTGQTVGNFIARANDPDSARLSFNSFLQRMGRNSSAGFGYRPINN